MKNKIYDRMTAVSGNAYFDVLDYIVNKYKNTVKMKPTDVTSDSYAEFNVDSNGKDPKFKVCDHVRISKYKKKKLLNDILHIGQRKFSLLVKLKMQFHRFMLLVI